MRVVMTVVMRVGMAMLGLIMAMAVGMLVTVIVGGPVGMAMRVMMREILLVRVDGLIHLILPGRMFVRVRMFAETRMFMRMGVRGFRFRSPHHHRRFYFVGRPPINAGGPWCAAFTIQTHNYSISIEINSISRPRRNSPLGWPQRGHS